MVLLVRHLVGLGAEQPSWEGHRNDDPAIKAHVTSSRPRRRRASVPGVSIWSIIQQTAKTVTWR